MIELIQILAVVFSGLFAAEAIIASNGTKAHASPSLSRPARAIPTVRILPLSISRDLERW